MIPLEQVNAETGEPHVTDHGIDTQDQRHRRPAATPDPAEVQAQKVGRWSMRIGISITVAAAIISLSMAVISDNNLLENASSRLFATLALVTLMLAGASLIIIGRVEMLIFPIREKQRHTIGVHELAVDRLRITVERLVTDTDEQYRKVAGTISGFPHLLSAIEQRLAAVEAGQHALVESLPEEVQRQYWVGFNDAVREGFQEGTGTDGTAKQRRAHMGLVGRDGGSPK